MYIPKHYLAKNDKEAVLFMQRFNFAVIITSLENRPTATHLPFVIEEKDDKIYISSHFAKANPHWKVIEQNENLIVFTEPHAYISPENYNKKENVPTWNYMAVHAYGKAKIFTEPTKVIASLETMIDSLDSNYKKQWNELSDQYKSRMVNGIVAFEMEVSELQSKRKLSQNKKENERKNIIENLAKSEDTNEKIISEYMQQNESKNND